MGRKITILSVLLTVMMAVEMLAQDPIKKEVRVVKPYEPTLSGAFKINMLPVMEDTVQLVPDVNYSIRPKAFHPEYVFRPLKPARMESEQIPKLYPGYLKLGFGSYATVSGELYVNSLRSRKSSLGAYIKHISSYGKTKLGNDKRVNSGYGDTDFGVFGKKIYKKSILSGDVGANQKWMHFYGYNPALDTALVKDDIRQNYMDLYGVIRMESGHLDSTKLLYRFKTGYHYFEDRFKNRQHEVHFNARMGKGFLGGLIGGDLDVLFVGYNMDSITTPVSFISLEPWYSKRTGAWNLDLALNMTVEVEDGKTTPKFYPKAKLLFHVVPQYLTAYVGVTGELERNTYRSVTTANLFLIPGLYVQSTDRKLQFYGGFNGSFSRRSSYHIRGSFALVDRMPFFVNDTISPLGNTFNVEYDDVQIGSVFGEISTKIGSKFDFFLKGTYYSYGLSTQKRAWHKPDFDITGVLRYNLQDKILINLDIFYVGKRYAKSYVFNISEYALEGFADLNLKLEYRYTKILSVFLRFNNILGNGYQLWNQYPVQRFSVFGGFTYAL